MKILIHLARIPNGIANSQISELELMNYNVLQYNQDL